MSAVMIAEQDGGVEAALLGAFLRLAPLEQTQSAREAPMQAVILLHQVGADGAGDES